MRLILWALIAAAFLQSCATQSPNTNHPYQPEPLSNYQTSLDQVEVNRASGAVVNPTDTIHLNEAVSLTLMQNPQLAAYPYEIRAQEALAMQAGFAPNPELEMELENFTGTGDLSTGDSLELTTFFSQLIETANKRSLRNQIGNLDAELAQRDYQTAIVDVLSHLAKKYLNVLAAQERIRLLEELVNLSEETLFAITERVRAGRVSPLEATRAKVELASERNALDVARQELSAAKTLLAAMWGADHAEFASAEGALEELQDIPPIDSLLSEIESNPDLQIWATEMQRRSMVLKSEKAKAVPDITLSGGLRYLNESDDAALVAAITIPLQLHNRNQGAIRAAQERVKKAEFERKAIETDARSNLISLYQQLRGAQIEIKRLQTVILPGAEEAHRGSQEGYREGEFDYLTVLDSQRTLFESRVQYVNSLTRFHQTWISLERLIGQPLKNAVSDN